MKHLPATAWTQTVDDMRHRIEEMLERMADSIKDALLDWETDDEPGERSPAIAELPPLDQALFVAAVRGKMEDVLWRMADAVNEAPSGRIVAASEAGIRDLMAELYVEALELGVQMRLDAAETALPPPLRPQGKWARRWRRMTMGGSQAATANRMES